MEKVNVGAERILMSMLKLIIHVVNIKDHTHLTGVIMASMQIGFMKYEVAYKLLKMKYCMLNL